MKRIDGRANDQLRPMKISMDFLAHPLASVLIEFGGTKVLSAVSIENKVPNWMRNQRISGGWLTCEYGMLPASTHERMNREVSNGKPGGRTMEIQRLIGRSLRSVLDLERLRTNTIYIDCDVIDADGGTRCASISGASFALHLAMRGNMAAKIFEGNPMRERIAAVSVGMVDGELLLDLCYDEDSRAEVDMNVVMTESGKLVEIQGTAERMPFDRKQLNSLLDLAECGIKQIFETQNSVLERKNSSRHKASVSRPGANLGSLGGVFDSLEIK